MGGGGDEDDRRELERLERDLAAIDARWSAEGYQQRTSSKVLDDERATRTELQLRIMKLEAALKSSSATPALGTGSVRANTGIGWQPLELFSREPAADENDLPLAPFDVSAAPAGLAFAQFEQELVAWFEGLTPRSAEFHQSLNPLLKRWAEFPDARRLLAAACDSVGFSRAAASLWPRLYAWREPFERAVTSRFLVGASESPDLVTGLTPTQRKVLEVLAEFAPPQGPFVDVEKLFVEAKHAGASATQAELIEVLVAIAHPSLRPYPLVEFLGFQGRFSESPSFTHARLTALGRDVLDGSFALPNLLLNGAVGTQTCLFPYPWREVTALFLRLLDDDERLLWVLGRSLGHFEFPDRATAPPRRRQLTKRERKRLRPEERAPEEQRELVLCAEARVRVERFGRELRGRVVIDRLPWPLTAEVVRSDLERARAQGGLEGVTRIVDESSANAQRLVLELEHILFGEPTRRFLERTQAVRAVYASWPPEERSEVLRARGLWLRAVANAFIQSRFERWRASPQLDAAASRVAACESICVALALLERVQDVIRRADDDEAAVKHLTGFLRAEDRPALEAQPFPLSHDYAQGFTLEQARHVVRQRRLGQRPVEAAQTDWARALDELESARQTTFSEAAMRLRMREELHGLSDRFRALGGR